MARKNKIEEYRENAPEVPTNTCPYIDFIQDIIKEIVDETDSVMIEKKAELADSALEYIRESNELLRSGSAYWYQKFSQHYNKP